MKKFLIGFAYLILLLLETKICMILFSPIVNALVFLGCSEGDGQFAIGLMMFFFLVKEAILLFRLFILVDE